jgi:hypothetical protein
MSCTKCAACCSGLDWGAQLLVPAVVPASDVALDAQSHVRGLVQAETGQRRKREQRTVAYPLARLLGHVKGEQRGVRRSCECRSKLEIDDAVYPISNPGSTVPNCAHEMRTECSGSSEWADIVNFRLGGSPAVASGNQYPRDAEQAMTFRLLLEESMCALVRAVPETTLHPNGSWEPQEPTQGGSTPSP